MTRTQKKPWKILPPPPEEITTPLEKSLSLHPLAAKILARKGLDDPEAARNFLEPSLKHLHDPFSLNGMAEAVARIVTALENGERIVISGDYDVDGITSTALLTHFLTKAGCTHLEPFIPNRFDHGYGLTPRTVDALLALKPTLVITVDNGITAIEEAALLHNAGVDTVITDHHLPREEGVPPGIVVNPLAPGCNYPFKKISGVGVAFKLITALRKTLREKGWWNDTRAEPNLKEYLDLVAIGTIADIVPLEDENRVLVAFGLEMLNKPPLRLGIQALLDVAKVTRGVNPRAIGFQIAPRINAAGRMSEGRLGVDLLLAEDKDTAQALAIQLDGENQRRREKGDEMFREAIDTLATIDNLEGLENTDTAQAEGTGEHTPEKRPALVVASPNFHEGIIGIIASRLTERFDCPAAVLAENGSQLKGSLRSDGRVNVTAALTRCAHLLSQWGGHAGAAGCTLPKENLAAFRETFAVACRELEEDGPEARVELDGELTPDTATLALAQSIEKLGPFGHGNKEPTFLLEGTHLTSPPTTLSGKHLKWSLPSGVEMLAWSQAEKLTPTPHHQYRVTLGLNEFRGVTKVQLIVQAYQEG